MTPENEKKKAYLSRYQTAKLEYDELREELDSYVAGSLIPSSYIEPDQPRPRSRRVDGLDWYYAKRADYLTRLAVKEAEILDSLSDIAAVIDRMPPGKEQVIMRYRYILGKKWGEIAEIMTYSDERYVQRLHGRGLEMVKLPSIEC